MTKEKNSPLVKPINMAVAWESRGRQYGGFKMIKFIDILISKEVSHDKN